MPNKYQPVHQYRYGNTGGLGWEGPAIPWQNRVGDSFHGTDWKGPKRHFFSLTLVLFHLKHAVMEQQYPEIEKFLYLNLKGKLIINSIFIH